METIKVRKLSYDTITTETVRMDSVTPVKEKYAKSNGELIKPKIKGFLNEHMLLRGNNLYVFSQEIPEKIRDNSSGKQSKKFWRKIRRMKKRKNLHYFKIPLKRFVIEKDNKEIFNTYLTHEIYEPYGHQLIGMVEEKVEGSTTTEPTKESLAEYRVLGDTIFIKYDRNSLDYLKNKLTLKSSKDLLILNLENESRINTNRYRFRFDLKNTLENTVTIIKNDEEEFVCNYTIKGRTIYIENPPIPQFTKGKINSRITRLKFNVRSTTYTYE